MEDNQDDEDEEMDMRRTSAYDNQQTPNNHKQIKKTFVTASE